MIFKRKRKREIVEEPYAVCCKCGAIVDIPYNDNYRGTRLYYCEDCDRKYGKSMYYRGIR